MDSVLTNAEAIRIAAQSAAQSATLMVSSAKDHDSIGIIFAGFVFCFLCVMAFAIWAVIRTSGEAERTRSIYQEQQGLLLRAFDGNTEAMGKLRDTIADSSEPHLKAIEDLSDAIVNQFDRLHDKVSDTRCKA